MKKKYQYEPREDITVYELAYIEMFFRCVVRTYSDVTPNTFYKWDLIKRHFEIIKDI